MRSPYRRRVRRISVALLAAALLVPKAATADVKAAAGAELAGRHVRRGMDLPTNNEPAAAVWAAVAHESVGLFAGLSAVAVLSHRSSGPETRRLDELALDAGWRRRFETPIGAVSGELAVHGTLYPRRIPAGYGAVILEPGIRLCLPNTPAAPAWHLHYDTTPLQQGWFGGLTAGIAPRLGSQPIEIVGELAWIESYLKQDTPDIVSTTMAAGVVGFLVALAPATAELEMAFPVALERFFPARSGSVVVTPYLRLVLTSPFVPSLNPDGGEVVVGLRLLAGKPAAAPSRPPSSGLGAGLRSLAGSQSN